MYPIYFLVDGLTARAYAACLVRMAYDDGSVLSALVLPDHGLLSAVPSYQTTMNDVYYLRSSGRRSRKTNVWFGVAECIWRHRK